MPTRNRGTRLPLGRVVLSRRAAMIIARQDVMNALERVARGDWGEVGSSGGVLNRQALQTGGRLLSVFHDTWGTPFWIIIEPDRSRTTVLLPEEY